jgi:micrococcal nuclease
VLLFAGGIVLARMVAPADPVPQTVAEVPEVTDTPTEEPTAEPTVATPTPFVPVAALPGRKLDGADLSKAEKATVTEVIDGDTILVRLDTEGPGPDLADITVRFYGIDAPEVAPASQAETCGPEAKQQLAAVLRPGTEILLLPDKRDKDRFDRLLRYVFLPEGNSLDAGMVAAGLANAWTSDGTYKKQIQDIEKDATNHRRGCLWGSA